MSQVATAMRLTFVSVLATSAWAQLSKTAPATNLFSNLGTTQGAAQVSAQGTNQSGLSWRPLGLPSLDLHLAGPATGPAEAVWYSADGGSLFVRTSAGAVFETADFEHWTKTSATPGVNPSVNPGGGTRPADAVRLPEAHAQTVYAAGDARRTWSLGQSLSVSDDDGRTWTTLSGSAAQPVIGGNQRDIAVDPTDPSAFAVANDEGVWQSRDGGKTWAGLNDRLPNLPLARILSVARGAYKVALADGRTLQLADSRGSWQLIAGENALAAETGDRQKAGGVLNAPITAFARAGEYAYAGSADGRVWVSRDRAATWSLSETVGRGSVDRIFVDPAAPAAALAVISGTGAHLVRTVNAGAVWDDITGNLSDTPVRAATADRASSMAYVVTDRGVFAAHVDLNVFTPPSAWVPLAGSLPPARGVDVALDANTGRLFVALEGYGLYTAQSPVRGGALRVINAADFSTRAAAPGSVISVIGGKVTSAQSGNLLFPVLAAADSESQVQVPFETRATTVDLAIATAAGRTTLPLEVHSVSPAIFVDHDGQPFLVDADTGLALDAAAPARPGLILQMMATGLGRVQPEWPTGVPAPAAEQSPTVVARVQAFLDGAPLQVTRATLAPGYVGYYEVEVQLPSLLDAGASELYLVVDGQESNRVRLNVETQPRQ